MFNFVKNGLKYHEPTLIIFDSTNHMDYEMAINSDIVFIYHESSTYHKLSSYDLDGNVVIKEYVWCSTAKKSEHKMGEHFDFCPHQFRVGSNSTIQGGSILVTNEGYFYRIRNSQECYFICGLIRDTTICTVWVNDNRGYDSFYPLWYCYDWEKTFKICNVQTNSTYDKEKKEYHYCVEFIRGNEKIVIKHD